MLGHDKLGLTCLILWIINNNALSNQFQTWIDSENMCEDVTTKPIFSLTTETSISTGISVSAETSVSAGTSIP